MGFVWVCVGEYFFVFPLCGFSLSFFCNYLKRLHPRSQEECRTIDTPSDDALSARHYTRQGGSG